MIPPLNQRVEPSYAGPAPGAPDRPRRPWPWPLAIPAAALFWLAPRRMSPVVAQLRWPGVLAAYGIWVPYGVGATLMVMGAPSWSWLHVLSGSGPPEPRGWALISQAARAPLAELITQVQFLPGGAIGIPLMLAMPGFLCVGLALASAPLLNSAGSVREMLLPQLRLGLICATAVFPATLLTEAGEILLGQLDDPNWPLVPLFLSWAYLVVRGGADFSPLNESAAARATPDLLCERCGYALLGLSPAGRCPECGTPISEASPARRRAAPRGWLRSLAAALVRPSFFREIQLRDSRPAGRLLGSSLVLSMFILAIVGGLVAPQQRAYGALIGMVVAWAPFIIGSSVTAPRWRVRTDPHKLTIWAYGVAWLQGLMVVVAIALTTGLGLARAQRLPEGLDELVQALLIGAALFCLFIALLVAWRVRSGLRKNRFANA